MRNGRKSLGNINLPEHFIDSLRVLFDILDTSRTGFISYNQLEHKWSDLPTSNLPSNLLACLREVTPHSGMLTFERFLAGIRLSLQSDSSMTQRLHRVRSEGKLDEIYYNNKCSANNSTSHKFLKSTSINGINGRPILVLNAMTRVSSADTSSSNSKRSRSQSAAPPSSKSAQNSIKMEPQNYNITLRTKKNKNVKAPLPPLEYKQEIKTNNYTKNYSRIMRPLSTNSVGSLCSSGMTDLKWRDSHLSNSPPHAESTIFSGFIGNGYSDELKPQVAKHEQLLGEEFKIVLKGLETTRSLLSWYENRMESLEKRKKMLEKGMVALDSAVHEQKLNFYRAQITELNRMMKSLVLSSEYGFPNHSNMMQIRSQVQPKIGNGHVPPSECCTSASSASSTSSNGNNNLNKTFIGQISNSSSPEPQKINFLAQQQKLIEVIQCFIIESFKELENKNKIIQQLQYENRVNEQARNLVQSHYNNR